MSLTERKTRVLLIEDDAMSRDLWTLLLEAEGHQVRAVDSGEMAVAELSRSWRPNLILMDVQLPGLSGAPLAAALRSACGREDAGCRQGARNSEDASELPDNAAHGPVAPSAQPCTRHPAPSVIVLAMSGSEPRGADALAGFDGFLLKPFSMEALEARINAALEARDALARQQAEAPLVDLPQPTPHDHPARPALALDPAIYQRLSASMPPSTLAALYALCLCDVRTRIDAMRLAAAAHDEAAYQRQAHAIKGGCGMVGAAALAALADAMETDGLAPGTLQVTARANACELACNQLEGMLRSNPNETGNNPESNCH